MITAVCLNPAIDHTVTVPALVPGGLNRVKSALSQAAGKGVNVAITMRRLGVDTTCVAFLPDRNGAMLARRLEDEGIAGAYVATEGAIRTNTKIVDLSTREVTEVNESGAAVTDAQIDQMTELLQRQARSSGMLVLSGSLPPGCPPDYYRRLIESLNGLGCRCVLDADAARLKEGLKARPFLIKPNRAELEQLTGAPAATLQDIDRAARGIARGGVGVVCVSLGGDGAYITDGDTAWRADCIRVEARSTVGAGDAMIGGLAAAFDRGEPLKDAFRLGVACGTASVMSDGTGLIDRETVDDLMDRVVIARV